MNMIFERLQGLWDFPLLARLRPPVLTWKDAVNTDTNIWGPVPDLDTDTLHISSDTPDYGFYIKDRDCDVRYEWTYQGQQGSDEGLLKAGTPFSSSRTKRANYDILPQVGTVRVVLVNIR